MKTGEAEVGRRVEHFKDVCREAGVKLTHQRLEIFGELARSDEHPNAEQVLMLVRKRMPTVSLDTVYRTLWMLNDLGLIRTLGPARERARFDANLARHHHFVCVRCGLTRDFSCLELDRLKLPEAVQALGHVEAAQVEVRGVCVNCSVPKDPKPKSAKMKEHK